MDTKLKLPYFLGGSSLLEDPVHRAAGTEATKKSYCRRQLPVF